MEVLVFGVKSALISGVSAWWRGRKVGLKPYDNIHILVLKLFFASFVASQGQFPN